jgi:hypothetical protein
MAIRYLSGINVDSNTLFVDSDNNRVGIGTASPAYRLDVNGASRLGSNFIVDSNGDAYQPITGGVALWVATGNATYPSYGFYGDTGIGMYRAAADTLAFSTSDTERLRITSAGNVGIGTTAPGSILHVTSSGANSYSSTITKGSNMKGIVNTLSNNANDMVGIYFATGTAEGAHWSGITGSRSNAPTDWGTQLNFYTHDENLSNINDATQKMVIKGSGNVGIGTTAPGYRLHVKDSANVGTIAIGNDTYPGLIYSNAGTGEFRIDNRSSAGAGYITFYPNGQAATIGSEAMRITTAGNVGIGTTAPDAKLVIVTGSADDSGNSFSFTGYSSKEYVSISKLGFIRSRASDLNGANIHFIDNGGTLRMEMAVNTSSMTWYSHALASTFMVFQHTTGNVGIGTTSPTVTLEVSGRGLITSSGSSDTFAVTHSSGSGIGVNITKGGNGEGLYVNKTSGSGNAVTIVGTLNATTLVKSGGTSSQYLMADGSVSTLTNPVTGTGTTNYVSKWTSSSAIGNSQIFDNGTNVGIGTTSSLGPLNVAADGSANAMFIIGRSADNAGRLDFYANNQGSRLFTLATGNGATELYGDANIPMVFSTNGTERLRILAGGNVGIGTTSPSAKFHVQGSNLMATLQNSDTAANQYTQLEFVAGSRSAYIWLGNQNSTSWAGDGGLNIYTTTGNMDLWTAGAQRMRITSGGNVGIGTASPGRKLTVQGADDATMQLRLMGTASQNSYWEIGREALSTGQFRFIASRNGTVITPMVIDDQTGNVGIGTTSPGVKLDIDGGSNGVSVRIKGDQPAAAYYYGYMYDGTNLKGTTQTNIFYSGSSIAANTTIAEYAGLRIDAPVVTATGAVVTNNYGIYQSGSVQKNYFAGNVGIGTTAPSSKLHIDSALGADVISISDNAGSVRLTLGQESSYTGNYIDSKNIDLKLKSALAGGSGGNIFFQTGTSAASTQVTINVSGNVGIGTTAPNEKLEVAGAISATGATAGLSAQGHSTTLAVSSGVSYLYAVDWGAEFKPLSVQGKTISLETGTGSTSARVTIDNAGNVGIGTTAPTSVLHVNGANNTAPVRIQAGDNANYYFSGNSTSGYAVDFLINDTAFYIGHNSASRDFTFKTNSIDRVTIKGDGNVGIGTTSPSYKLQVQADGAGLYVSAASVSPFTQDIAVFRYGGNGNAVKIENQGGKAAIQARLDNGTAMDLSLNASGGNVGIGTTAPLQTGTNRVVTTINGPTSAILNLGVGGTLASYYYADAGGSTLETVGTNTIAASGANIIQLTTNGLERLRITSAGSVFINSTSMDGKLGINTATSVSYNPNAYNGTNANIRLTNGSAGAGRYTGIAFGGGGSTEAFIGSVQNTNEWAEIVFQTFNGSAYGERARITSAGNVGIGTMTPQVVGAAWTTLEVKGKDTGGGGIIYVTNAAGTVSSHFYSDGSGSYIGTQTNQFFAFTSNNAERMRIDASGNVGIGTTTTSSTFLNIANSGPQNEIVFRGTDYTNIFSETTNGIQFGIISTGSTAAIEFFTNNTEKMRITSAGNVGIGTTAPASILHVSTTGANAYSSTITKGSNMKGIVNTISNNADDMVGIYFATGTNAEGSHWSGITGSRSQSATDWSTQLNFYTHDENFSNINDATQKMVIKGSGNVGIGTTAPASKLHIETSASNPFRMVRGTTNFGFEIGGGAIGLYDYEDVTYRWYVDSVGNIGIGTTSPAEKLHVVGIGRFDGVNVNVRAIDGTIITKVQSQTVGATQGAIGTESNNDLAILTNNTTRILVTAAGNVGIGTTSPVNKLQVTSATNGVEVLRIDNTAGNSGSVQGVTHLGLNFFGVGNNSGARITAYQESTSGYRGGMYFSTRGVNSDSAPSEAMRISPDQLVGIGTSGTTAADYRLTVDSTGVDYAIYSFGSTHVDNGALGVGVVPSATIGRIDASNDIVAYSTSDSRLKENITPIANALDKVKSLTGVEFDWKEETKGVHGYEGHDVGVIAQEVQAVLPEAIRTNDTGYLSVRYEKMIALLIEANKELAARVEELENKLK